jgi:hypothetical protein
MIVVRGKSVGKQDRRDEQRAQDELRKNNNAVLGNIKQGDLFYVAGFQTKILALGVFGLEPLPCHSAKCPLMTQSGSWLPKFATMRNVEAMSALHPKADISCGAEPVRSAPDLKRRPALQLPEHRRLQYQDNERCFRSFCDQEATGAKAKHHKSQYISGTLASAPVGCTRSRIAMLRNLYRLDDAARRMRARVLTVIFAAALAVVIAMIVFDFVGH